MNIKCNISLFKLCFPYVLPMSYTVMITSLVFVCREGRFKYPHTQLKLPDCCICSPLARQVLLPFACCASMTSLFDQGLEMCWKSILELIHCTVVRASVICQGCQHRVKIFLIFIYRLHSTSVYGLGVITPVLTLMSVINVGLVNGVLMYVSIF